MLSDYEINRISKAIVSELCNNDRFIKNIAKMMKDKESEDMVNSTTAAKILGISRKSVCAIAEELNGIRGRGRSAHWLFPKATLTENYIRYKQKG